MLYVFFILIRDGVYRSLLTTLQQRYVINIAGERSTRQEKAEEKGGSGLFFIGIGKFGDDKVRS